VTPGQAVAGLHARQSGLSLPISGLGPACVDTDYAWCIEIFRKDVERLEASQKSEGAKKQQWANVP
jgi:hypothetical protein